jgi:hypothetical protein
MEDIGFGRTNAVYAFVLSWNLTIKLQKGFYYEVTQWAERLGRGRKILNRLAKPLSEGWHGIMSPHSPRRDCC